MIGTGRKKYGVIYIDPPWQFKTHSAKGLGRSAEAWYDCLSVVDIKALPIADLALPDCILLMWVTDPFLKIGLEVVEAWQFTYKTVGFYWVKQPFMWFGTGYWTRANPEQCLLATRGHPKRQDAGVPKLITSPRREHSQKPDEAYERIERLCAGPYVELFATQRRAGWDSFGKEVDSGPERKRRWKSNKGPDE